MDKKVQKKISVMKKHNYVLVCRLLVNIGMWFVQRVGVQYTQKIKKVSIICWLG